MDNDPKQTTGLNNEGESLEGPAVPQTPAAAAGAPAAVTQAGSTPPPPASPSPTPAPPKKRRRSLFGRFSIYFILFVIIVVLMVGIVVLQYLRNNNATNKTISPQDLTQSDLSHLGQSSVTVGDPKQVLNVQSNAVFGGQVLVRSDLQVAGKLQVGGTLALTGLNVSGDSLVNLLQVNKNLQVAGDSAFQGQLTVQKNLAVNGSGAFNGALSAPSLTVNTLQLNGDLSFTRHITAGGATPSRSNGGALGSGGTASVSGSDTAGSVAINTGNSPGAGCFVTVNFTAKFNSTPHVVITPVESAAGALNYYVTRNTSGFSVCTATAAPGNASFGFDYIIFD